MSNDMSPDEVVHQELSRFMTNYYRDRFRLVIRWLFRLITLNVLLAAVVFYLYIIMPKNSDRFYASNIHSGKITELHPLSAPVVRPQKLLGWATQSLINIFNFNFVDYRDSFSAVERLFTVRGWSKFYAMLRSSGILDTVVNRELFVSAAAVGNAKVIDSGVQNGRYAWKVQVPLLITYKADNGDDRRVVSQRKVVANAIISRVASLNNSEKIAITDLTLS